MCGKSRSDKNGCNLSNYLLLLEHAEGMRRKTEVKAPLECWRWRKFAWTVIGNVRQFVLRIFEHKRGGKYARMTELTRFRPWFSVNETNSYENHFRFERIDKNLTLDRRPWLWWPYCRLWSAVDSSKSLSSAWNSCLHQKTREEEFYVRFHCLRPQKHYFSHHDIIDRKLGCKSMPSWFAANAFDLGNFTHTWSTSKSNQYISPSISVPSSLHLTLKSEN